MISYRAGSDLAGCKNIRQPVWGGGGGEGGSED